jgi:DNA-binding NarL/FixJ family response regulator
LWTLLIDDSLGDLELLARMLGGNVVCADTLERGIGLADRAPAAILIDQVLKKEQRSGIDSIPTFHAIAPTAAVIVVTNDPNEVDQRRAFALGAVAYVDKADAVDLPSIVERAVRDWTSFRRSTAH